MFGIFDWIIFILAMALNVYVGYYFIKRARSADDYIVANKQIDISVYVATMVATGIGGGNFIGQIGQIYGTGLVLMPSKIAFILCQLLIAMFLAEKIRNRTGYTAPDVLRQSYGRVCQFLGGLCSMIYLLGTGPALQTIALGTILNVVLGVPYEVGAVVAMCVIVFYTYSSGLWGVAMTDYVQFIIMGVGTAAAVLFALNNAGGWDAVTAKLPETFFTLKTDVRSMIELVLVIAIPSLIDGNRYQRFYAAKDARVARKGYYIACIPWYLIIVLLFTIGYISAATLPDVPRDKVFINFLLQSLPMGIKGLVFSALIAAIMSTADSYILAAATNFSEDIYHNVINPKATDAELVRVTRRAVLGISLLGLGAALILPSVMGIWKWASTAYVGGCFIPMMAALFYKGRKSAMSGLISILAGSGSGLLFMALKMKPFGQAPILVAVCISLLAYIVANCVFRDNGETSMETA